MILKNEYVPYFEKYLQLVDDQKSIIENLQQSQQQFDDLLSNLPEEKRQFSYAQDKWTVKELIQHIIDTERIFCYRALCFARNDKTDLPGFDEVDFAKNSNANARDFSDLVEEMQEVRKSTIKLFNSFSDEALLKIGTASGNKISVRALGFLFSGHQLHHLNILKERYL